MPVAYGTPTDLPELLDALAARVAARATIDPSLVFPTLQSDEELVTKPSGDTFVTLRLGRCVPVQKDFAGGALTTFAGVVLAQLWTRTTTDQDRRAVNYLRAALGRWLYVFDALEGFTPTRASDATLGLVIEPVRAADAGFEVPNKKPDGWGRLDSAWSVKFVHRRPA